MAAAENLPTVDSLDQMVADHIAAADRTQKIREEQEAEALEIEGEHKITALRRALFDELGPRSTPPATSGSSTAAKTPATTTCRTPPGRSPRWTASPTTSPTEAMAPTTAASTTGAFSSATKPRSTPRGDAWPTS
jgi:hypothetical protein